MVGSDVIAVGSTVGGSDAAKVKMLTAAVKDLAAAQH